jgi:YD repeat-containing protein
LFQEKDLSYLPPNVGAPAERYTTEVRRVEVLQIDLGGVLVWREVQEDGRRHKEDYTYDDQGRVVRTKFTGAVTETVSHELDDQGNILTLSKDIGNDGSLDRVWRYTYDDQGVPLTQTDDKNGDGVSERHCTFTERCRKRIPVIGCARRCQPLP